MSDWKASEEVKVAAAENGTTRSSETKGSLVRQKSDLAYLVLRLLCMATSVTALSFMLTARKASTVSIYGFQLPIYSKWSYSRSFK